MKSIDENRLQIAIEIADTVLTFELQDLDYKSKPEYFNTISVKRN